MFPFDRLISMPFFVFLSPGRGLRSMTSSFTEERPEDDNADLYVGFDGASKILDVKDENVIAPN